MKSIIFFLIVILINTGCNNAGIGDNAVIQDNGLTALKSASLVDGETIEEYFNELAGIGGKVNWEKSNTTQENVSQYKVSVVRGKSVHKTLLSGKPVISI